MTTHATLELSVEPHPLLEVCAFESAWPLGLGAVETPAWLEALKSEDATAPLQSDDLVRGAVRDLLRASGFKPTGRSKPASEYLLKGVPTINGAVDACNVVSLHSGLPISILDADRLEGALRVEVCGEGVSYPFNPSGQVMDAAKLLALCDAAGPAGTPVKDAQRTKTHDATRRTITVIWGTAALSGRADAAGSWLRELLTRLAR